MPLAGADDAAYVTRVVKTLFEPSNISDDYDATLKLDPDISTAARL